MMQLGHKFRVLGIMERREGGVTYNLGAPHMARLTNWP